MGKAGFRLGLVFYCTFFFLLISFLETVSYFEIFYLLFLYEVFFKVVDGFLLKAYSLVLYFKFEFLHILSFFFKYSSFFSITSLLDLFVTDYPVNAKSRFEVTYVLLSHFLNFRVFFKFFVSSFILVPSIYIFFPSGNWLERES